MAAAKMVFHHMVLIFHSFEGFSDLEDFWDDLLVSRLKYNALEDFQDDLLVSGVISAASFRPHAASEKLTPSRLFLMESPVPSPSSSAPIDPGGASPVRSRRRSRSRALARERALSSPPEIGNVKDLVLPVVKYSEVKTDVLKNLVVKDSPACEVSVEGSVSAEKQVAVDEVQLEEGEICEDPRGAKGGASVDDLESSRSSRLSPKIV
ncbi:hypothetical protein F2Q69_00006474 [Brassica cretica]|uniref:Uncharacterized protein n=1 Tax=Brassica cretica TaxID=69181 RepID=A0A8S9PIM1_BRACR|nr:hypothetical protein F2Q69_00006474 [Brassica cretica]